MELKNSGNTKRAPVGHGVLCYLAISTKMLREDKETTLLIINVFSLQRRLQDNKQGSPK